MQKQQYGSWCGPAAVSEALSWLGYGQTQSTLASYMGTTTAGTDFGEVMAGLNHYTPTGYHWINLYSGSYSASTFSADWANDMYEDIITKGNRPVINDVQIGPQTEYLAGYTDSNLGGLDIWHYLTTDGYTAGYSQGYQAHYEDSNNDANQASALGSWWFNANTLEYDSYHGNGLTWATE